MSDDKQLINTLLTVLATQVPDEAEEVLTNAFYTVFMDGIPQSVMAVARQRANQIIKRVVSNGNFHPEVALEEALKPPFVAWIGVDKGTVNDRNDA